jgi:hypothetical protein
MRTTKAVSSVANGVTEASRRVSHHNPGLPPEMKTLLRLRALPFAEFARGVARLLTALGYESVELSGRTGYRGRNRDGGYDLAATAQAGLGKRRVVVQLKQFGEGARVYQRNVDELRGAALRAGADEAILITTGIFSGVVQDNHASAVNAAYQHGEMSLPPARSVIPVHLLDGAALAELVLRYRIEIPLVGSAAGVSSAFVAGGGKGLITPTPPTADASGDGFPLEMTLMFRFCANASQGGVPQAKR